VLARYAARGIAVLRSDRCGAFTLPARPPDAAAPDAAPGPAPAGAAAAAAAAEDAAAGPPPPAGRCEREAARRYWHHPGAPAG
jgi:hypothetical protein